MANPTYPDSIDPESLFMLRNFKNIRHNGQDCKMANCIVKYFPNDLIEFDSDESLSYRMMQSWIANKHLKKIDGAFSPLYRFSLSGKCKVACMMLKISLLELCIMTEAYITHKSQAKNDCKPSYVTCGLAELLGGIYQEKTINKVAYRLYKRQMIERVRKSTIRLSPDTMKKLGKWQDFMIELHNWIISISYMLSKISFYDQKLVNEIKN